jgi:hypothetical protein
MMIRKTLLTTVLLFSVSVAHGGFTAYDSAGVDSAAITPTRDAFRTAVGGGTTVGANGSFGGLRREINWDGVPDIRADPNLLPADFFNVNSPRGAVFTTPGTGFMVSANSGQASPVLFGFPNDFQTFSAQRLFTALNSTVTDVFFFVPGTNTVATTSAFGVVLVDVETALASKIEFFDQSNSLIFSQNASTSANQGLSFLGGVANAGERISRVRITSGVNTLLANGSLGNPNDDIVVMDDFLYAEPVQISEPPTLTLLAVGLLAGLNWRRSRQIATRLTSKKPT